MTRLSHLSCRFSQPEKKSWNVLDKKNRKT